MQQEKRGVKTRMRSPEGPSAASRNRIRSPEGPGLAARSRVRSPEVPAGSAASRTRVKSPEVGNAAGPNRGRSPEGVATKRKPGAVKKAGPSTATKGVEPPARKKTWSQDMRALSKRGKRSTAKAAPEKPKKSTDDYVPSFMRPTLGSEMKQRSHKERKVYPKKKPTLQRIGTRRGKVKIGKDGKKVRRMKSIRLSQSFRGLRRSGSMRSMDRMKSIKQLRKQITFGRSAMGGRLDEGPSRLADIAEENRSPSPFSDRRISQEYQQPPRVEVDLDITDSAMLRDLGAVVLPVASSGSKETGEVVAETAPGDVALGQGFGEEVSDDELCQSDAETKGSTTGSLLRRSRGVVRQRTPPRDSKSPSPSTSSSARLDQVMDEAKTEGEKGERLSREGSPLDSTSGVEQEGIPEVGFYDLREPSLAVENNEQEDIPIVKVDSEEEEEEEGSPGRLCNKEGEAILFASLGGDGGEGSPGSDDRGVSPFVNAFGKGQGGTVGSDEEGGSPYATAGGDETGASKAGAKEGSPIIAALDVGEREAPEKENPTHDGDAEKQVAKEKTRPMSPSPIIADETKVELELDVDVKNDDLENISSKARALPADMLNDVTDVGVNDEHANVSEKVKVLAPMRESVGSCEVKIVESMLDGKESGPGVLDSHAEEEEEEDEVIMPTVQRDPMHRRNESDDQAWNLLGAPSMISSVGSERLVPVMTRTPSDVPQLLSQTSEIGGSFLGRFEEQLKLDGKGSGGSEGNTTETTVLHSSLHKRSGSNVSVSSERRTYAGECSKIVEESEHLELVEESLRGVRHTTRDITVPYVTSESRSKSDTPRRGLGSKVKGFWWELGAGFVAGVLTAVWLAMAGGCDACDSDNEVEFQEIETVPLMVASAARPHPPEPSLPVSSPPICTGTHRNLQEEWLWHNE